MEEEQTKEPVKWYVLGTVFRRETKIRDDMRQAGFECYVPMRYIIMSTKLRKERKLVPAIHEIVFVHSTESAIKEYKSHCKDTLYFKTSGRKANKELMVVPSRDMENFIKLTQHTEQNLTYFHPDEIRLSVGDKIKVHGGAFDGVEGVLMRVPGKRSKQLVVSIPELSAVAVSLSPDMIEIVDKPVRKSTDIDSDLKVLFSLAYQKLFAAPDQYSQENENNILTAELRRTLQRVETFKGYTAAREAEISLPVFMATKALELDTEQVLKRVTAAAHALKDSSMLKLRLQLYIAVLTPDQELEAVIVNKMKEWSTKPLSEHQRQFKEEMKRVMK